MIRSLPRRLAGFTLIELLTALLLLSLLALMSYRSLGAVLDARDQVARETEKWRAVEAFLGRFERDVELAAPRPVRNEMGNRAAWLGRDDSAPGPTLELSRFAASEGADQPRRVAYTLNAKNEIELWLWPGLDVARDIAPARYPVLKGVTTFGLQYLNGDRVWVQAWPDAPGDVSLPRAVKLHIVLASGEDIVRVFALAS